MERWTQTNYVGTLANDPTFIRLNPIYYKHPLSRGSNRSISRFSSSNTFGVEVLVVDLVVDLVEVDVVHLGKRNNM